MGSEMLQFGLCSEQRPCCVCMSGLWPGEDRTGEQRMPGLPSPGAPGQEAARKGPGARSGPQGLPSSISSPRCPTTAGSRLGPPGSASLLAEVGPGRLPGIKQRFPGTAGWAPASQLPCHQPPQGPAPLGPPRSHTGQGSSDTLRFSWCSTERSRVLLSLPRLFSGLYCGMLPHPHRGLSTTAGAGSRGHSTLGRGALRQSCTFTLLVTPRGCW